MPSQVVPMSLYCSSSCIQVYSSGLWLTCREVSPRLSTDMAATLSCLVFGWFNLTRRNLNDFLWLVLTSISLYQCFHQWFVRVYLVHCPVAFRPSTTLWLIPVCASTQTLSMILCRGTAFSLFTLSSYSFAWYTLFSLAVYLGFFVAFPLLARHIFFCHLDLTP